MNICLFFEGTGQGVEGRFTNVTRMKDMCAEDDRQRLHVESGSGTRFGAYIGGSVAGTDWRIIFRSARRWFEANYEKLPRDSVGTIVFIFGFSRGALFARHSDVGGLYEDNHVVADLALAWVAEGARREGLRFRKGVRPKQNIDVSGAVLHDEHAFASNLWGAFDRVKRKFSGLRLHRAFRKKAK